MGREKNCVLEGRLQFARDLPIRLGQHHEQVSEDFFRRMNQLHMNHSAYYTQNESIYRRNRIFMDVLILISP